MGGKLLRPLTDDPLDIIDTAGASSMKSAAR